MISPEVLRYAAFTTSPTGGNPAGVVLDALHLDDADMQAIAADVGYSETAFVTGSPGSDLRVRFFAPESEVDFCGHATIATAAALTERHGARDYIFRTNIGAVDVSGDVEDGTATGSFLISEVGQRPLDDDDRALLLELLGWNREDLHQDLPPAIGDSGNLHPVLVAARRMRLDALEYDFDALQSLCRARGWVTLQLIAPMAPGVWRARNPFPWGGVVEDPATGSAAAAFLGYLRAHAAIAAEEAITIEQGVEMGRPSRVTAVLSGRGARISGPAVQIGAPRSDR